MGQKQSKAQRMYTLYQMQKNPEYVHSVVDNRINQLSDKDAKRGSVKVHLSELEQSQCDHKYIPSHRAGFNIYHHWDYGRCLAEISWKNVVVDDVNVKSYKLNKLFEHHELQQYARSEIKKEIDKLTDNDSFAGSKHVDFDGIKFHQCNETYILITVDGFPVTYRWYGKCRATILWTYVK